MIIPPRRSLRAARGLISRNATKKGVLFKFYEHHNCCKGIFSSQSIILANNEDIPLEFNSKDRKAYINNWLMKRLSDAVTKTFYTITVKVILNIKLEKNFRKIQEMLMLKMPKYHYLPWQDVTIS